MSLLFVMRVSVKKLGCLSVKNDMLVLSMFGKPLKKNGRKHMHEFEVELKQTLYWIVNYESDIEDPEEAVDEMMRAIESDRLSELEDHYSFAAHEEREAVVMTMNGEKYGY